MIDPQRFRRRLTARYVFALSLVALLAVSAQGLIQHALQSQATDSREVNLAGRQRMLSQRIAKHALHAQATGSQEALAALRADVGEWGAVHHGLLRGDRARGLPGTRSSQTRASLDSLSGAVATVARATRQLSAAAPDSATRRAAVAAVLAAEDDFLPRMDRIVLSLDQQSAARVRRLRLVEGGLLLLTLLVLALEARYVFYPAVEWGAQSLEAQATKPFPVRASREMEASKTVLNAFRWVLVAAAVAVPAFWVVYRSMNSAYYDPLALRLGFSGITVVLFAATFVSDAFRRYAWRVMVAMTGVVVAYFTWLAVRNGLDAPWTVGVLTVGSASVLAVAPYSRSVREVWSSVSVVGVTLVVTLMLTQAPFLEAVMLAGYFMVLATLVGIGGALQVRTRHELRAHRNEAVARERLLRTVIDAIPGMIFVTDRDGKCVLRNLADSRSIGYEDPEDTLGLTVFDTVGGARAQELWDADQAMMEAGEGRTGYESQIEIGGETRYYSSSKVPLTGPNGEVVGLVGFDHDVTSERAARAAQRESDDRMRATLDSAPDAVLTLDADGVVLDVNPAVETIFGFTPDEMLGARLADRLVPPSGVEGHQRYLASLLRAVEDGTLEGAPQATERESIHADGSPAPISVIYRPVESASGETLFIVYIRDLRRQKAAEAQIVAAKEAAEAREAEAAESQRLLRTIINTIPDHIYALDAEGRFVLRNKAGTADFSIADPSAAVGLTEFDLAPHDIAAASQADNDQVVATGVSIVNREEKQTRGRWFSVTKVPLCDGDGAVVGVVGVSRDITEQRRAQAALVAAKEAAEAAHAQAEAGRREVESSQRLLRTVMDAIPDFITVKDREGRCLTRNLADAQVMGYDTVEESIGITILETSAHPETAAACHAEDLRVMETGQPLAGVESERTFGHGWKESTKIPLRDDGGQVIGLVSIMRDVTERKEAEAAVLHAKETAEAQRQLLRTVIDTIPDHIYVKDREGRATLRNRASARALGYEDPAQTIGRADTDDAGESGQQALRDDLAVIETGTSMCDREEPAPGGRWLLTTKVPLRDASGAITGLVGVSRDVTAQRAAATELLEAKETAEAATRAKSEFLANMSHEIRTPMNGVIGMTSLLMDTPLDGEQRDFVETIRTSGDALLTIINDILDFSKIEAGMLSLELHPFEIRTAVEEALDLVAQPAALKGVELAYLIEDGVPRTVLGDVTRVRQVLVNLLSNAVKFTLDGSVCVRVDVEPAEPGTGQIAQVRFAIEDTGIGIAPDKLDLVFQSFSQADASTTRQFGGTGLGLTICRRLTEMMGGEIGVESELGHGSTFRFSIAAEVTASEKRVFQRREQPALEGRRVLVIDDNAVNREILSRLSTRWRMVPDEVISGPAGIEAFEQADAEGRPYDLILLDMQMPVMDGMETAHALRALAGREGRPGPGPVVIMLTSIHRDGNLRAEADAAGIHRLLYKPTKPSQLYDVIIEVFDERGAPAPEPADAGRQLAETAWVARPAASDEPAEPSHSVHILLAEDNVVNQKVATRLLGRLGYSADVVANGAEALAEVERRAGFGEGYDIVFMDVQMPEMDGLEATRRIRASPNVADQPWIVSLTANAMEGDREACLAAGADDYLPKPVQLVSMREAVERAVQNLNRAGAPSQSTVP